MFDPAIIPNFGPIAIMFAAWLTSTTVGGMVGNEAYERVRPVLAKLRNLMSKGGTPANHDLQKAFRRSSLKATTEVCDAYIASSGRSPVEVAWARTLRRALNQELKTVDGSKYVPPPSDLDDSFDLLFGSAVDDADPIDKLRQTLVGDVVNDIERSLLPGPIQPTFRDLLEGRGSATAASAGGTDWFSYLCLYFAEEVKTNPKVANIVDTKLLAKLSIDMPKVMSGLDVLAGTIDQVRGDIKRIGRGQDVIGGDVKELGRGQERLERGQERFERKLEALFDRKLEALFNQKTESPAGDDLTKEEVIDMAMKVEWILASDEKPQDRRPALVGSRRRLSELQMLRDVALRKKPERKRAIYKQIAREVITRVLVYRRLKLEGGGISGERERKWTEEKEELQRLRESLK